MVYLPRGKIVVAAVNDEGEGYFESDLPSDVVQLPGGGSLRVVFDNPRIPITGVNYNSRDEHDNIANKSGVRFNEAEMAPGEKSPMHATPSVDLGIVITGSIVLSLESGVEKTLVAGDLYILKAASHAWENRTSEPARWATVLLAANK